MRLSSTDANVPMDVETGDQPRNVQYFRDLLATESARLEVKCKEWDAKLEVKGQGEVTGEELEGQIRACIGKARLLMNRKGRFEQFRTLIDNCEFNRGEQKTTCMDLQVYHDLYLFVRSDV